MLLADVNVLIHAHRSGSPRHAEASGWLSAALEADEPFGVSELVLSGFLCIVTNHRAFEVPTPLEAAMAFCTDIMAAPATTRLRPGPRHWAIFAELCARVAARGGVIPDAYHAALAVENGATLITTDRGFARFPGLRWREPFGPEAAAQC